MNYNYARRKNVPKSKVKAEVKQDHSLEIHELNMRLENKENI